MIFILTAVIIFYYLITSEGSHQGAVISFLDYAN
jgi:hypothetical protein